MDFCVRFDDIDLNNHVNNAVYPLWATEAVDNNFRTTHNPEYLEISFKKEGLLGEKICVETQNDGNITLHSIKALGENERELAKVRIRWKSS